MSGHLEAEPGRGELRLSEAAERLGCHVETLRLRVRAGKLDVRRGAHGAYLVTEDALSRMPPLSRRPNAKTYTEAELADTWLVIQREFERYFWEDAAEIKLLGLVRKQPAFHLPFYRVATVRRLRLAGLGVQEIAHQLGISARHVRRLRRRNVYAAAKAAVEQIRNRLRMDRGDARRVMAALRARLVAEGFRPHQRTVALKEGARPPRSKRVPAIKTYRLTVDEYRTLERAGLTTEELWAIFTVGIPTDDLHELLVRGAAAPRKDGKGP